MTTHYHLVVEGAREALSRALQRANGHYAQLANSARGRTGHLFGDRFAVRVIEDEEYLLASVRYVLLNPVRAGLCERPEDWPWSGSRFGKALDRPRPVSSAPWELDGQVALVSGGGRGIGPTSPRELAGCRHARRGLGAHRAAGRRRPPTRSAASRSPATSRAARTPSAWSPRPSARSVRSTSSSTTRASPAGRSGPGSASRKWWHVFEVNVLGAFHLSRAVLPGMVERGRGRIVNVASGAAYLPGSRSTAYSASKAALNRFSETLAVQLDGTGVAVFPISPGLVRTEMTIGSFPRRRAVDAAGVRAAARARARDRGVRPALRPVPPRRARSAGRAARPHRRDPRGRPERDPAQAVDRGTIHVARARASTSPSAEKTAVPA